LTAYQITNDSKYFDVALESLDFLIEMTFDKKKDYFIFPGNKGWFAKSGDRNIFDQQPIEAGSATEVYSLAFKITKNEKYRKLVIKAFDWFNGKNIMEKNMVDEKTGGIYDGFSKKEVNKNQGAESVLAYLLAYSSFNLI
jgi:rhamnogalacturonyl hydrolase YesR